MSELSPDRHRDRHRDTPGDRLRDRFHSEADVDSLSARALINTVSIPSGTPVSPWGLISRRMMYAVALVLVAAVVVYLGRGGYTGVETFLDAVYYATASLSTTGYGDIAPASQSARLVNVLIITPMRVVFVILLVGTTLSVLTEESRKTLQIHRWRNKLRDHTVIIGYGTKGRAATAALLADGTPASRIVVVDSDAEALTSAQAHGLVTVHGSATRTDILRLARVTHATAVVVAPNQDDTAVLITLSVREIAPDARVVAAVREAENAHLVKQSGADSVVVSSETAGRMLGMATINPSVTRMMKDLLSPDDGFSVAEREVADDEVGSSPRKLEDIVLGVLRDGELYRIYTPEAQTVEDGDRLFYIRQNTDNGTHDN